MRTLGVDLSAEPSRTAVCSIDWSSGEVTLHERGLSDAALVELILSSDRVGIDAPLGWPDAFIDALDAHQPAGGVWPGRDLEPVEYRRVLRFRLTDAMVTRAGSKPLSVSSDRIGVTAMRCARLQALLAVGEPVDRSGTTGRLAEVYPAAALRAWDLPSAGYKRKDGRAALADLAQRLVGMCSVVVSHGVRAQVAADDDDFDALICALVARAVAIGHTTRPRADELEQAQREGWIHVPTVDPRALLLD